ncbi:putative immunoglobulin-blocking virulence protein [Mycoplasma phocimorsus]|uniref:putative immunoglobulin-blocking virulence protein n=1 Tax=Mycoplasma phocimorsus TaxID=3045839 RepID=UPI0024C005EE|nr:putative immunoglobulin-blocking virulence protein [Mycoplasma phocimorsus]MDJ1649003.1 putative immunoglobulin-blocking virulence protein [Mycoplasma phocimorsus]
MKRKNRTLLLSSILTSMPLLAASGYFGLKYSSGDGNLNIFKENNDKLQSNGRSQNNTRNYISDFNFENEVPKIEPKKDPIPLEIPKTEKPININENKLSPFIPKKEKDKPQKIIKAPNIDVKPQVIPNLKPSENITTPSIPSPNPVPSHTPNTSSSSIFDSFKNLFSSSNSNSSSNSYRSSNGTKTRVGKTVNLHGVNVNIEVDEIRPRDTFSDDDDIKNWKGYIAEVVPSSVRVQVTDELIKGAVKDATTAIKSKFAEEDDNVFKGTNGYGEISSRVAQIKLNWANYYENKFEKYEKLFMSDNVKRFLTKDGQDKYHTFVSISDAKSSQDKKIERFIELFNVFDYSKLSAVSQRVKNYLKEGLYIETSERNVYVNENGELDSYAFTPLYNSVTGRMTRDNSEKRPFAFNETWPISPEGILNNDTPGWTKSEDLTTSEFKEFGVSSTDGIKIYKKTRNTDNKAGTLSEGYVIDIDASNSSGLAKTAKLIKDLTDKKKVITQYRISNVGLTNNNDDATFNAIMQALPENLPQLTLILEGSNTKFLRHLENKKIEQLDLFTTKNNRVIDGKSWSINPWALKGVAWVNTNDYNSGIGYIPGVTVASRIVFDSLYFDQEDVDNNLERINKGLRMAYYVRNNEGIFQGSFGNGLRPDHDEGNNSYPVELDLSRTDLKTLKGLIFYDKNKPNNKHRKLLKLTFKGSGDGKFEIPAADLDQAQYDVLDLVSPGPPRARIDFSTSVNSIKLTGAGNISGDGFKNLNILLERGSGLNGNQTTIYVDSSNTQLKETLKSRGFNVQTSSTATEQKLN